QTEILVRHSRSRCALLAHNVTQCGREANRLTEPLYRADAAPFPVGAIVPLLATVEDKSPLGRAKCTSVTACSTRRLTDVWPGGGRAEQDDEAKRQRSVSPALVTHAYQRGGFGRGEGLCKQCSFVRHSK